MFLFSETSLRIATNFSENDELSLIICSLKHVFCAGFLSVWLWTILERNLFRKFAKSPGCKSITWQEMKTRKFWWNNFDDNWWNFEQLNSGQLYTNQTRSSKFSTSEATLCEANCICLYNRLITELQSIRRNSRYTNADRDDCIKTLDLFLRAANEPSVLDSVSNMKALVLVGTFNLEKALIETFSMIVKTLPMVRFQV